MVEKIIFRVSYAVVNAAIVLSIPSTWMPSDTTVKPKQAIMCT